MIVEVAAIVCAGAVIGVLYLASAALPRIDGYRSRKASGACLTQHH